MLCWVGGWPAALTPQTELCPSLNGEHTKAWGYCACVGADGPSETLWTFYLTLLWA